MRSTDCGSKVVFKKLLFNYTNVQVTFDYN